MKSKKNKNLIVNLTKKQKRKLRKKSNRKLNKKIK